ncbi:MAG TPA: class IIb bacteriocin, lactobin A/cerein 7B family [Kofleriaceae bacterium]
MKTEPRNQDEHQVTTIRTTDLDAVTGGWIPLVVAGVGAVVAAGTAIWTAGHSKGMADRAAGR